MLPTSNRKLGPRFAGEIFVDIPAFYLFQASRLFRKRSGDLISTGYSTTLTDPACAYADEIRRVYIHGLGKFRVWLPTRFKLQIEVQGNLPRDAIATSKISISHISRINNFPFWLTNLVTRGCFYILYDIIMWRMLNKR